MSFLCHGPSQTATGTPTETAKPDLVADCPTAPIQRTWSESLESPNGGSTSSGGTKQGPFAPYSLPEEGEEGLSADQFMLQQGDLPCPRWLSWDEFAISRGETRKLSILLVFLFQNLTEVLCLLQCKANRFVSLEAAGRFWPTPMLPRHVHQGEQLMRTIPHVAAHASGLRLEQARAL